MGSKISAVGRAKLSKKNYPAEELYPRNYLTEEKGNYRKITTDQVVGVSYVCHLLLQSGDVDGLEKQKRILKMLSKDKFGEVCTEV